MNLETWKKIENAESMDSVFDAIQLVKESYTQYDEEYTKEYKDFNDKTSNADYFMNSQLTSIRQKYDEQQNKEEKRYSSAMKKIDELISTQKEVDNDLKSYFKSSRKARMVLPGLAEKIVETAGSILKDSSSKREEIGKQFQVMAEKKRQIIKEQHNSIMSELSEQRANEEKKYKTNCSALKNELDGTYSSTESTLYNFYSSKIKGLGQHMDAYEDKVYTEAAKGKEYTPPEQYPEFVYLGDLYTTLCKQSSHSAVDQLINNEFSDKKYRPFELSDTQLRSKVPYFQTIGDGLSLFIKYDTDEKAVCFDYLKSIMLKLFMNFPSGRLEATMIDPVEYGSTFSLFKRLGEEKLSIIDTKIWSQYDDIEKVMKRLTGKIEIIASEYGENMELRLKKEAMKVLAITDFPKGFSEESLRRLEGIIRKSRDCGICVIILGNSEDVEKLESSGHAVMKEINNTMLVTTAKNGDLIIESGRLKGSCLRLDPMTEQMEHRTEIIEQIAESIGKTAKHVEYFVDLFKDAKNEDKWLTYNSAEEAQATLGVKGADSILNMPIGNRDGDIKHNALIAGPVGSGKTTLFHTMIMSLILMYSHEDIQLYLIDFKDGVGFKPYTKCNIPSIKVVALESEREFGLSVLKELVAEKSNRAKLFKKNGNIEKIYDYRTKTNKPMPRIFLIFDEVHLFFGGDQDEITTESLRCLNELVTQGSAYGIHVILASQDFRLAGSLKDYFSLFAIRLVLRGSEEIASTVLDKDNRAASLITTMEECTAIYNDSNGHKDHNKEFKVAFISNEQRDDLLERLSKQYDKKFSGLREKTHTRILMTNIEDDIYSPFTRITDAGLAEKDDECYSLFLGNVLDFNREITIGLSRSSGSNLLMIGADQEKAFSLFYFTIMSILYGDLGLSVKGQPTASIYLIDLSDKTASFDNGETSFSHITSYVNNSFEGMIKSTDLKKMEDTIKELYNKLLDRMDGEGDCGERIFIMFFGVNRAHKLKKSSVYSDEKTAKDMLSEILRMGPQYGINTILWGEKYDTSVEAAGSSISDFCNQRIVFSSENDVYKSLVMHQSNTRISDSSAVYMDVDSDVINTHFRPYSIPGRDWVESLVDEIKRIGGN